MDIKSKTIFRKILLKVILVTLVIFLIGVISLSLWIELELKKTCEKAMQNYPGEKVEALMMSLETNIYGLDSHIYEENIRIIWALGQLGDNRALPFLNNLVTEKPCDHETNLCQVEIQEAIQKLNTNQFNLPKFLWRGILNY